MNCPSCYVALNFAYGNWISQGTYIESTSGASSGTKQFFFDSRTSADGVYLALSGIDTCVTVSRVLVYRYECPGQKRGPLCRPATRAPVHGHVAVTPNCAENNCGSAVPEALICTSQGIWYSKIKPEHDSHEDKATCKGNLL